jgi:hypothetical protein
MGRQRRLYLGFFQDLGRVWVAGWRSGHVATVPVVAAHGNPSADQTLFLAA